MIRFHSESLRHASGVSFQTYSRLNIDPAFQPDFPFHRSGWGFALRALQSLHTVDGVLLDSFLERTFCWQERVERRRGHIPYRRPWVGILHNPPGIPVWHDQQSSPQNMLRLPSFRESLKYCQGIFVLSDYLRHWLQQRVDVSVVSLLHPTEIPAKKFSPDVFLQQAKSKIVNVGWWLRRLSSIFQLSAPGFSKCLLQVRHPYFKTVLERDLRHHNVSAADTASVTLIPFLKDAEYDTLLSRSVVFCDLFDSSANNTIIECIARATPLLVNPLPAAREYLGDNYPLYFRSLNEAQRKVLNTELILAAHEYLAALPIDRFSASTFCKAVSESEIYCNLASHCLPYGSRTV